jgi:hypothetical protein
VANAELECEIDPSPIIKKLTVEAGSCDSIHRRRYLYGRLASIQAKMGNIDTAISTLREGDKYGEQDQPHTQVDIAIAQAKAGLDPSNMFAEAKAISGKMLVRSGDNNYEIVKSDSMKVLHLLMIAKAEHQSGLDPLLTFMEAIDLDNLSHRSRYYPQIVENLAACRYFQHALQLADKIGSSDDDRSYRDDKTHALALIAEEQCKAGNIEEAIQIAGETNSSYVLAHIFADSAVAKAKRGENPQEYIDEALKYMALELHHLEKHHKHVTVELYTYIGQAQTRCGIDSNKLFTFAFNEAENESEPDDKANAYLTIAKHQALGEIDPADTLRSAMKWADQITAQPSPDILDEDEQSMLYEQIADAAVDAGCLDIARVLADKLSSTSSTDKAQVLIGIGIKEAQRGLSQIEIDSLSPNIIQQLLSSKDEEIRKAIVYFGFGSD